MRFILDFYFPTHAHCKLKRGRKDVFLFYVVALEITVRMYIQASRSVPAESPLLGSLWTGYPESVSYSTVMMPKYGKSGEQLKRNK